MTRSALESMQMHDQLDAHHRRNTAKAAKAVFETVSLLLAYVSAYMLFHLAGIPFPRVTQLYGWLIFLFCLFGFQRLYAGLLWFLVLLAKPEWVGVRASAATLGGSADIGDRRSR